MLLTLLSLWLLPLPAQAFRLVPIVQEIDLKGPKASATFLVENDAKTKVAIQFSVRKRLVDVDGNETRPPAENFLLYPEQMALAPGEKRNVRLTWIADKMPEQEIPFRFIASQLPIDFQEKQKSASHGAGIKFLIEYVASLYLVPPGAKPKARLLHYEVKDGKLELLVANEGTAHLLLTQAALHVKAKGKDVAIDPEAVKDFRAENLLAGGKRLLRLPLPKGVKDVSVDIDFHP
jgi:fimbrial chaperone protein